MGQRETSKKATKVTDEKIPTWKEPGLSDPVQLERDMIGSKDFLLRLYFSFQIFNAHYIISTWFALKDQKILSNSQT